MTPDELIAKYEGQRDAKQASCMALKDALVASLGEELLSGLAKPEGAARVERDGSGP